MALQNRFAGQEESLKLLFPCCRLKHLLKTLTTEQHLCSSISLTCCAWRYHTPPPSHQMLRVYPSTAPVPQPQGCSPSPQPPQHWGWPTGQLEGAHGSRGKQSKDQTQPGERDGTLSSRTLSAALNNPITLQQLHLQANHENTEY